MNREILRSSLEQYRTPFEEEAGFVEDFIGLTHDVLAFRRERLAGHLPPPLG